MLVDPSSNINPVVCLAHGLVDGVAVFGIHERPCFNPAAFQGVVELNSLRARHTPIFLTEAQQRWGANLFVSLKVEICEAATHKVSELKPQKQERQTKYISIRVIKTPPPPSFLRF